MTTGNAKYLVCAMTAFAAAAPAFAADLDGDGVPDGNDVCCNTPAGVAVDAAGRPLGDLDFDCDVDLADFAIFALNITGPLAPVACPDCSDGIANGSETDVDCGGGECPPCADGLQCFVASDCQSMVCNASNLCATPSCSDGVQNGGETGVDCGGPCPLCPMPNGSACTFNAECLSFNCVDGVCCNTPCTALCQACDLPGSVGSCANIPNGQDPDNECAGAATCNGSGACAALSPLGAPCSLNAQCASNFCVDGVCCNTACAGVCQACNLTGSVGGCANIPTGQDPANECPGAAFCNGAGVCTP